jgi:hypothetical protein
MRTVLNRYDDHGNKQGLVQDDGAQVTIDKKAGSGDDALTWRFDPNLPQPLYYESRTDQDDVHRTVLNRFDDHPNGPPKSLGQSHSSMGTKDTEDDAGDLDNAKYKHQFEGHNDYNAAAGAKNHYP